MAEQNLKKFRALPFWSWNDKLSPEELKRQIDCFAAAGCGGFFIHSRVGLITPYLSDEWMRLVKECCVYAKERGMTAWLYDEDMWPSGYAGGRVPAASESFRDRYLCLADEAKEGDAPKKTFRRGGREYTAVRRVSPAGNPRFNGQSYIDTLNPEAVRAFLDCTLEAYEKLFGGNMREYVGGIFTDEPCYIMRAFAGRRAVPYSECMDGLFKNSSGMDLCENIPKLFFDGGNYREVRFHYYKCLSERFTESYVKQYRARCAEHGILFTGHLMGEESCTAQTAWIGSAMSAYLWFDVPGVDKIFRGTDDLVQYKQLTSVCEQFKKERALCECFAGLGQECGMLERKRIVDFQALNGINLVNPHLSLYSMRGERKRDYPPNLFFQQPYYEQEGAFGEYVARMSAAAAYGRREARILIVHPLSTVWSSFRPRPLEKLAPARCDRLLKRLSKALLERGAEFHYGDETLLAEHGRVSGGKLHLGGYAYDKIALCGNETLFSSTIALLRGLKVYALSPVVRRDGAEEIFLSGAETFETAEALAEALCRGEPAYCEGSGVLCSARRGAEGKLFLFVNASRGKKKIKLSESLYGAVEIDTATGARAALDLPSFENFYPLQSKLLWLGEKPCDRLQKPRRKGRLLAEKRPRARICDFNALCLDKAAFFVGGEKICEETHLSKIWHERFYPLSDGTPFAAEYRFCFEGGAPAFAAVENAENLDGIYLNGVPLRPMRRRGEAQVLNGAAYIDPSLTRVPLSGLRRGQNVLRIEGKKYNNVTGIGTHRGLQSSEYYATEVEPVFIVGDFAVREGKIAEGARSVRGDVSKGGYPHYAGRIAADVQIDFERGGDFIAELAGGKAAAFALYLDGVFQGCRFAPPYRWDIRANCGAHKIRLTGYGTLFNMFGPRYIENYRKRRWVTAWDAADPALYSEKEIFQPLSLGSVRFYEAETPEKRL